MYNTLLNKFSKPIYKIGIILLKIGIVTLIIGLVLGVLQKGWLLSITAFCCCLACIIIINIPNSYLTSLIKEFDESISAKEATKIAQNHLRSPIKSKYDTTFFVQGIIDGEQQIKRTQQNNQTK
jgi:hypothetical protein